MCPSSATCLPPNSACRFSAIPLLNKSSTQPTTAYLYHLIICFHHDIAEQFPT